MRGEHHECDRLGLDLGSAAVAEGVTYLVGVVAVWVVQEDVAEFVGEGLASGEFGYVVADRDRSVREVGAVVGATQLGRIGPIAERESAGVGQPGQALTSTDCPTYSSPSLKRST